MQALLGRAFAWCFLLVLALTTGCALPPVQPPDMGAGPRQWTGRLVVKTQAEPPARFAAAFDLQGSAANGRLVVSTPLGTTLAVARWWPGGAELKGAGPATFFSGLDDMTEALAGTRLPVTALFDWLDGHNVKADGWEADLTELDGGKLTALRLAPAPVAELRLVLDVTKGNSR